MSRFPPHGYHVAFYSLIETKQVTQLKYSVLTFLLYVLLTIFFHTKATFSFHHQCTILKTSGSDPLNILHFYFWRSGPHWARTSSYTRFLNLNTLDYWFLIIPLLCLYTEKIYKKILTKSFTMNEHHLVIFIL